MLGSLFCRRGREGCQEDNIEEKTTIVDIGGSSMSAIWVFGIEM